MKYLGLSSRISAVEGTTGADFCLLPNIFQGFSDLVIEKRFLKRNKIVKERKKFTSESWADVICFREAFQSRPILN